MKLVHSTLAPCCAIPRRGDILAQALLHPDREFSLSDLRHLTGHGLSMVHKEVNLLVDGGILLDRRAGRTRQVSANPDHPLIGPLTTMVEATYGALPVIAEALEQSDWRRGRIRLRILGRSTLGRVRPATARH